MRRLLLALALPLLAGCPTSPGVESTLVVTWSLRDINGAAATCDSPGPVATTVRVILNGALAATTACSAGQARFDGLAPGTYSITVEALAADNELVFRDWTVATLGQGALLEAPTTPGRGSLRLAYTTDSGRCEATLPDASGEQVTLGGYMWFRLDDSVYGEWITVDETSSDAAKQFYQCGDWGGATPAVTPIVLRLPFGIYTLRWIKEERFPLDVPPNRADLYLDCTARTQEIHSAAFLDLPVQLALVTAETPACTP